MASDTGCQRLQLRRSGSYTGIGDQEANMFGTLLMNFFGQQLHRCSKKQRCESAAHVVTDYRAA